ncbi:MAG: hypothetical protein AAF636_19225 [Pseudomonadota bacterium]
MLSDKKQAELLLHAQAYRRDFCKDDDVFHCLKHVEHDMLLRRPFCAYDYVDRLIDEDGVENSGQVVFDHSPVMQLADDVYVAAAKALRPVQSCSELVDYSAVTTVCHEIAHVVLHTAKMKGRVGAALKRGLPNSGTSFRTDQREEEEANIFGGGLQAPIDVINEGTIPKDLQRKYRMSGAAARRLIDQKRRLASLIEEIRDGGRN